MTLLVPVDGADPAWAALEEACRDADPDQAVLVITVVWPARALIRGGTVDLDAAMERAQAEADDILEAAVDRAAALGVSIETEVGFGRPDRVILDYAALDEVERIVMGAHGDSVVSGLFLGRTAETVIRRSTIPVTVVK